jgi:hypothetical protein
METHDPAGLIQGDTPEEIARDILAISQIEAVPTLLEVLCETTGMRFAAVARVTESTWTACMVKDHINFGLTAGSQLDDAMPRIEEVQRAHRHRSSQQRCGVLQPPHHQTI